MKYPKGITRSAKGWRINLGPGGSVFRKRFPPETSQSDVEAALLKARQKIPAGTREPTDGLAADVTRYLRDYFTGRSGYAERKRHLDIWTKVFGEDAVRAEITRDQIARTLNQWRAEGLAAETCNKRRTALLALFHALDGRGGSNPVREVPKFRPPDPLPRGVLYDKIEKALAKLPACKSEARLRVLAYTGMRPGQLMKLTPDDWDKKGHTLTVPGTGKGRGTRPYTIPVSKHAHAALVTFDQRDAWGAFTWAPIGRIWRYGWIAAELKITQAAVRDHPEQYAHMKTPTVYDLRHSFGTRLYLRTGDLKIVKELLGHSSIAMTERYTLAAVSERKTKAIQAFDRQAR